MNLILFLLCVVLGTALLWVVLTNINEAAKNTHLSLALIIFNGLFYGVVLAQVTRYFSQEADYRWIYYILGGSVALGGNWANTKPSGVKDEATLGLNLATVAIYVIAIWIMVSSGKSMVVPRVLVGLASIIAMVLILSMAGYCGRALIYFLFYKNTRREEEFLKKYWRRKWIKKYES